MYRRGERSAVARRSRPLDRKFSDHARMAKTARESVPIPPQFGTRPNPEYAPARPPTWPKPRANPRAQYENRPGDPSERLECTPDDLECTPDHLFDAPDDPFDAPDDPFDGTGLPFDAPELLKHAPGLPFDAPELPFDAPGLPFDAPDGPFHQLKRRSHGPAASGKRSAGGSRLGGVVGVGRALGAWGSWGDSMVPFGSWDL